MATFEEEYCRRHGCDKWKFRRDVFWCCLQLHAVPFAWLCGGYHGRFFGPDRELIDGAALANSSTRLADEIRDFLGHPENMRFSRRVLRLRLSTYKLRRLARRYVEFGSRRLPPHS